MGEDAITNDPKTKPDCDVVSKPYEDLFTADASLNSFIKESSESLTTSDGQLSDPSGTPNICIDDNIGRINIATLYLAKALGLSVSNLINNYVYDTNVSNYVFPNVTWQSYPPEGSVLTDFPLLDQAYWTIISQYTRFTISTIDYGKSTHWCWWVGFGLMEHCKKAKNEAGCSVILCSNIHRLFLEACHRVRSKDTNDNDYKYATNTRKFCLPTSYFTGGYTDLTLYEVSRE